MAARLLLALAVSLAVLAAPALARERTRSRFDVDGIVRKVTEMFAPSATSRADDVRPKDLPAMKPLDPKVHKAPQEPIAPPTTPDADAGTEPGADVVSDAKLDADILKWDAEGENGARGSRPWHGRTHKTVMAIANENTIHNRGKHYDPQVQINQAVNVNTGPTTGGTAAATAAAAAAGAKPAPVAGEQLIAGAPAGKVLIAGKPDLTIPGGPVTAVAINVEGVDAAKAAAKLAQEQPKAEVPESTTAFRRKEEGDVLDLKAMVHELQKRMPEQSVGQLTRWARRLLRGRCGINSLTKLRMSTAAQMWHGCRIPLPQSWMIKEVFSDEEDEDEQKEEDEMEKRNEKAEIEGRVLKPEEMAKFLQKELPRNPALTDEKFADIAKKLLDANINSVTALKQAPVDKLKKLDIDENIAMLIKSKFKPDPEDLPSDDEESTRKKSGEQDAEDGDAEEAQKKKRKKKKKKQDSDEVSENNGIGSDLTADEVQQLLQAHNNMRKQAQSTIPELLWSGRAALFAQKWANYLKSKQECEPRRSPSIWAGEQIDDIPLRSFGENVAAFEGSQGTPTALLDLWGQQRTFFTQDGAAKCMLPTARERTCAQYTQVVWRKTTRVGCAKAVCKSKAVWVCEYRPAGNKLGVDPF